MNVIAGMNDEAARKILKAAIKDHIAIFNKKEKSPQKAAIISIKTL